MRSMTSNRHIGILAFAIVAALAFHGWALYHMHLLELNIYTGQKPRFENQGTQATRTAGEESKAQEAKRRSDELAVIFNEIEPIVYEEIVSPYQNALWQGTAAQHVDLSIPDLDFDDADLPESSQAPSDYADASPADLPPSDNAPLGEVAPPNSTDRNDFIADLILATDKIQGIVLDTANEALPTDYSIQIGSAESTSINGNALESNERIIELAVDQRTDNNDVLLHQSLGRLSTINTDAAAVSGQPIIPSTGGLIKPNDTLGRNKNTSAVLPSSNTFLVQVDYVPQKDASGYLFRVTLFPKEGIRFKRITQNYIFLVDRSHSIRPLRYELTKSAVSDALRNIYPEDTFNILVFDDHAVSMSPQNIPATPENIALAQQFIMSQKYGGAFTTTDLYSSLGQILPKSVPEKEVNTAILLSDGDTFLSRDKQRATIASWTSQNAGKMSLYCVPTGGGNNIPLLGLLSNFNKGALVHARKDREVGTTLLSLIDSIQHPIGKDLVATAIVKTPANVVTLYPDSKRMPNLYENTPYTIYGSASSLDDFHLFIQGRYYDDYLDIKMHIDLAKASPVINGSIQQQIAQQRAYVCYEEYLQDGKRSHLNLAKKLLAPYRTAVPFQ